MNIQLNTRAAASLIIITIALLRNVYSHDHTDVDITDETVHGSTDTTTQTNAIAMSSQTGACQCTNSHN